MRMLLRMHICMRAHLYATHAWVHAGLPPYTCICVRACVCVFVSVSVFTHITHTHVHTRVCKHVCPPPHPYPLPRICLPCIYSPPPPHYCFTTVFVAYFFLADFFSFFQGHIMGHQRTRLREGPRRIRKAGLMCRPSLFSST
jgi:hypothetical protein